MDNASGSADTLLYPSGTSVTAESETLNDDGVQNAGDLWVGKFDSQFFDAVMDGYIGEILVYGSRLSDADMTQALQYLEGRF